MKFRNIFAKKPPLVKKQIQDDCFFDGSSDQPFDVFASELFKKAKDRESFDQLILPHFLKGNALEYYEQLPPATKKNSRLLYDAMFAFQLKKTIKEVIEQVIHESAMEASASSIKKPEDKIRGFDKFGSSGGNFII